MKAEYNSSTSVRPLITRVKIYAELAGNCKKYRIKSRYGNKIVVEGRIIYDCFVLNNKADAVFYQGVKVESAGMGG